MTGPEHYREAQLLLADPNYGEPKGLGRSETIAAAGPAPILRGRIGARRLSDARRPETAFDVNQPLLREVRGRLAADVLYARGLL